jgi:hypothetical protein|tara:strand:- start:192 stop:368 length:177 start_codon:yes stop_codon:yes gene_type:complete
MGIAVIFFIGFLIFGAVISSFIISFGERPKRNFTEKVDSVDYDGGGNWGRIPPDKSKK